MIGTGAVMKLLMGVIGLGMTVIGAALAAARSRKRAPLCKNRNSTVEKNGTLIAVPGKNPMTFQTHPIKFMRMWDGKVWMTGLVLADVVVELDGDPLPRGADSCTILNLNLSNLGKSIVFQKRSLMTFRPILGDFTPIKAGSAGVIGLEMVIALFASPGVPSTRLAASCRSSNSNL